VNEFALQTCVDKDRTALALRGRPAAAQPCRYSFIGFRFLAASPPVQDLLFSAKHLFDAAMSWWQLPLQPGLLGPSLSQADEGGQDKKQ
jgi:hypothetical protein